MEFAEAGELAGYADRVAAKDAGGWAVGAIGVEAGVAFGCGGGGCGFAEVEGDAAVFGGDVEEGEAAAADAGAKGACDGEGQ